jgi:geranylgeranylglycerol-phosphate geranylgeranyltransferase
LTRPGTSALIFLTVFLPLVVSTGLLPESLKKALPALFIAMCTFIVNDIDDVETDKVNHPDRPLPSGSLLPRYATVFYFVCLALALYTTKTFIPAPTAYLYYLLLIVVLNYKYVAEQLPNFKSLYVASTSTFPVLIVVGVLSIGREYLLVAIATFLFVLGREGFLDYLDRAGDQVSFISGLPRQTITVLGFAAQGAALVLLSPLIRQTTDMVVLGLLSILSTLSFLIWSRGDEPRRAIGIMKVQMFCGLYFLIR